MNNYISKYYASTCVPVVACTIGYLCIPKRINASAHAHSSIYALKDLYVSVEILMCCPRGSRNIVASIRLRGCTGMHLCVRLCLFIYMDRRMLFSNVGRYAGMHLSVSVFTCYWGPLEIVLYVFVPLYVHHLCISMHLDLCVDPYIAPCIAAAADPVARSCLLLREKMKKRQDRYRPRKTTPSSVIM